MPRIRYHARICPSDSFTSRSPEIVALHFSQLSTDADVLWVFVFHHRSVYGNVRLNFWSLIEMHRISLTSCIVCSQIGTFQLFIDVLNKYSVKHFHHLADKRYEERFTTCHVIVSWHITFKLNLNIFNL